MSGNVGCLDWAVAMRALPLKSEYGPTLGQLLAPRWWRASRGARALVVAALTALVVLLGAAVLTLENAHFVQRGAVAFHFSYRNLWRVSGAPGVYVRIARSSDGHVSDSFTVAPLRLPPYSGLLNGYLPLFAARYEQALAREPGFRLADEGKTRINGVPGYAIDYLVDVDGRPMNGRVVLLLPAVTGARDGVALELLAPANPDVSVASPVGSEGVLHMPERSFYFGA